MARIWRVDALYGDRVSIAYPADAELAEARRTAGDSLADQVMATFNLDTTLMKTKRLERGQFDVADGSGSRSLLMSTASLVGPER